MRSAFRPMPSAYPSGIAGLTLAGVFMTDQPSGWKASGTGNSVGFTPYFSPYPVSRNIRPE